MINDRPHSQDADEGGFGIFSYDLHLLFSIHQFVD